MPGDYYQQVVNSKKEAWQPLGSQEEVHGPGSIYGEFGPCILSLLILKITFWIVIHAAIGRSEPIKAYANSPCILFSHVRCEGGVRGVFRSEFRGTPSLGAGVKCN